MADLTDLIAAHWVAWEMDANGQMRACDHSLPYSTVREWAVHLVSVVEQHTNVRVGPVLEDFEWHIQNAANGAVFAAETDDGQGLISWQNEMGIYQRAARLLRAALEGGQK